MESDARGAFPAAFFYRSFVLQYARKLGLDEPGVVAAINAVLAAEAPPALPGEKFHQPILHRGLARIPRPRRSSSLPSKLASSLLSLTASLVVCSALYAWWERPHPHAVSARTSSAPKVKAHAKLSPVAAQPAPPPAAHPAPLALKLSATERTWLSASSDGKPAFRGTLEANQSRQLLAEQTAHLVVGNAAGLSVEWNGRALGPLGRRGQVRAVRFTPSDYRFEDAAGAPSRDATE